MALGAGWGGAKTIAICRPKSRYGWAALLLWVGGEESLVSFASSDSRYGMVYAALGGPCGPLWAQCLLVWLSAVSVCLPHARTCVVVFTLLRGSSKLSVHLGMLNVATGLRD